MITNDPSTSVFAAALDWLQGTLLGTLGLTVAIIAVASVGILLMTGRLPVRRATEIVFGCFILFGASTMAGGIIGALGEASAPASPQQAPPPPSVYYAPAAPAVPTSPYDPYAGASLPPRR